MFFFTFLVQENDLLDRENIELMPIPPKSQGNSNVAAILASTENIDDDGDGDGEEENSNDLLDHESMEMMPIPSTSQGNSNTSTILKSTENNDDDDEDADSFTAQQLFSFAWQIAKGMVGISIYSYFEMR